MRLLDRLMSKLGYVPAERLTDVVCDYERVHGTGLCEHCGELGHYVLPVTRTTVKAPHIIVSADFKRGIPCS